jgi:hypothetical protein
MSGIKYAIGALWKKYRKAIGTALGGVTGGAITGIVEWTNLDLNPGPGGGLAPGLVVPIVGLLAFAGTLIAKPNALSPDQIYEVETGPEQPNYKVIPSESPIVVTHTEEPV